MQSSRMRTARSLTMGGCLLLGGVCSQGVSGPGGGVCSQGGLPLGGGRGVCSQGVSAPAGCLLPGGSAWGGGGGVGDCLFLGGTM